MKQLTPELILQLLLRYNESLFGKDILAHARMYLVDKNHYDQYGFSAVEEWERLDQKTKDEFILKWK